MPRYDYKCLVCEKTIEIVHSIKSAAKKKCPNCGKLKLQRLISKNVSIIFKGDGFYRSIDYINQKARDEKGKPRIHGGEPGSSGRGAGE